MRWILLRQIRLLFIVSLNLGLNLRCPEEGKISLLFLKALNKVLLAGTIIISTMNNIQLGYFQLYNLVLKDLPYDT